MDSIDESNGFHEWNNIIFMNLLTWMIKSNTWTWIGSYVETSLHGWQW
jgi:hypothetical protein